MKGIKVCLTKVIGSVRMRKRSYPQCTTGEVRKGARGRILGPEKKICLLIQVLVSQSIQCVKIHHTACGMYLQFLTVHYTS